MIRMDSSKIEGEIGRFGAGNREKFEKGESGIVKVIGGIYSGPSKWMLAGYFPLNKTAGF